MPKQSLDSLGFLDSLIALMYLICLMINLLDTLPMFNTIYD